MSKLARRRTKTKFRLARRLSHRTTRRCSHGRRPKQTNYFPALVTALRRAVRIWRRLMKLYPEFYDCGFYNEARKRHEQEERRRREIEPILRKVYGEPDPPSPPPQACWFTVPPLSA